MVLEDLGLIGNCQYSALVSRTGEVVWCCLPRFDSEPLFSTLLDEKDGGRFSIAPAGGGLGKQHYLINTNVLVTTFDVPDGRFRIIDFAPRFQLYGRHFRPTQLHRIIEPLEGTPCIRVVCDPRLGWSKLAPERHHGSNHIGWDGFGTRVRLTTDVPLSYLNGNPFTLTTPRHLAFTYGEPIEQPLPGLSRHFLDETTRYWQRWVKHCNIPPHYQQEVIRSALALKLHCFEDTGAIVAATTTSLPEAPGSGRTWDYRYCWLRDAYYVLSALRMLGHFEEREAFVHFLLDIVARTPSLDLAPLYRIDGTSDLEERILDNWPGYQGERPVRVGNGAATHRQNDVFGETVLALAPIFLDDRFAEERSPHSFKLIEKLADKATSVVGTPDTGIWEVRSAPTVQTFSSLMCWSAAQVMTRVSRLHRLPRGDEFATAVERIRSEIVTRGIDPRRNVFVGSYGGTDLDAALLEMVPLRFLPPNDPRLHATVDAIAADLVRDGWLLRYQHDDGLGKPQVAFVLCTFWLVEAYAGLGRHQDARQLFERALGALSPLGLLSEDIDPRSGRMWGNFPQAYSHVGLIHAAFAASPSWSEVTGVP
jgi:GH15 family glucan-1,4-alpha-glucosidase